jgi:hypothetical protein
MCVRATAARVDRYLGGQTQAPSTDLAYVVDKYVLWQEQVEKKIKVFFLVPKMGFHSLAVSAALKSHRKHNWPSGKP